MGWLAPSAFIESRTPCPAALRVESALSALRAGKPVIVHHSQQTMQEGFLVFAAQRATTSLMAFMIRHTCGFVCVALPPRDCDRLRLPPMCSTTENVGAPAYTVTVDVVAGTTTGISATDRAKTVRALADSRSTPLDFTRPGHVVPLRARAGGVLARAGFAEAALDLARLAGLAPVGVFSGIVSRDLQGAMANGQELRTLAKQHGLAMVSLQDLVTYRRNRESIVRRIATTRLPTELGLFRAVGYRGQYDGAEHVALVFGDVGDGEDVMVDVPMECSVGHVFGSLRCDCRRRLANAMGAVSDAGRGVIVYLRAPVKPSQICLFNAALSRLTHALIADLDDSDYHDAARFGGMRGLVVAILSDLGVRTVTQPTESMVLDHPEIEIPHATACAQ
jgi:3,4-dihydroxy 2-butanone 4-phosphate synthase / GTP cyclohydrolase II